MKLPKERSREKQLTFDARWNDTPLIGYRQSAAMIGDFFEQLSSKLFDAPRLQTDSTADICPDLKSGDTVYEVKSSRRYGCQYMLDLEQLALYEHLFDTGTAVWYIFWTYDLGFALPGVRAKTKHFPTHERMLDALAHSVKTCSVLTFPMVERVLSERHRTVETSTEFMDFLRLRIGDIGSVSYDETVTVKPMECCDRRVPSFELRRASSIERVVNGREWRKYYGARSEALRQMGVESEHTPF